MKTDFFTTKQVVMLMLGSFFVGILPAIYFYRQYSALNQLQHPSQLANKDVASLVMVVGRLIELPQNQQPTVATVSDTTKLTTQPFFAKAMRGDKVLLYSAAHKAILYRPTINKIIEVSLLSFVDDTATSSGYK